MTVDLKHRSSLVGIRIRTQKETLKWVGEGEYPVGSALQQLPIDEMLDGVSRATVFHGSEPEMAAERHRDYGTTEVEVVGLDSFEAALAEQDAGATHVAVLNFANAHCPGGGWMHGAGAQEENLHRRSNLFDHLANPRRLKERTVRFPLPEFGGIFSPNVCVFRGPESEAYAPLPAPRLVSIISAAAYEQPRLACEGRLTKQAADGTRRKLAAILGAAHARGVDALVLGAFGCGAFGNPPAHVAALCRELLQSQYRGAFRRVVFAIIDRPDRPDENARIFREVLVLLPPTAAGGASVAGDTGTAPTPAPPRPPPSKLPRWRES